MKRRLFAILAALALVTGGVLVPAGAAHASSDSYVTTIHNQGNGKCLDVMAEDNYYAQFARIQQYHCTGVLEQSWTVWSTNDDGCYPYCPHLQIQSRRSLQCMEVRGGSLDNGAQVDQDTCQGLPWQIWRPISLDGGLTWHLINVYSDKCLDLDNRSTADHARIQQWDCNWSTTAQQWRM